MNYLSEPDILVVRAKCLDPILSDAGIMTTDPICDGKHLDWNASKEDVTISYYHPIGHITWTLLVLRSNFSIKRCSPWESSRPNWDFTLGS